jgi:predicted DNA-binding transcriptional regulator AlpA
LAQKFRQDSQDEQDALAEPELGHPVNPVNPVSQGKRPTSSMGKLQFHVVSALAEFERDLIRDRTMAGPAAARARLGGRPRRMTPEQVKMVAYLMRDPGVAVKEICQTLGVSRSILYRYGAPHGEIPERRSLSPVFRWHVLQSDQLWRQPQPLVTNLSAGRRAGPVPLERTATAARPAPGS